MLPFGYVGHGQLVAPSTPLDVAVTVSDGVISKLAFTWAPGWTYSVEYSGLGATPAQNVRPKPSARTETP